MGLGHPQAEPAITIIDIDGDVTPAVGGGPHGRLRQAGGARAVVLNFTGLDYMNSGGIGLLVTLLVRAQRQKQQLLAYGLTGHYRQIFELTRLDDAIAIHDDEAAALAAAGACTRPRVGGRPMSETPTRDQPAEPRGSGRCRSASCT
jgi:anti-sigma B factor antagonist